VASRCLAPSRSTTSTSDTHSFWGSWPSMLHGSSESGIVGSSIR
jgi:hypothetical protein